MLTRITKEVVTGIMPNREEVKNENALANAIIKQIREITKKDCKVVLVGSIAKGTFLRERKDVDIFLLFPKHIEKSRFEGIIRSIVKRAFPREKVEIKYAEHPYARVYYKQRRLDIVPAYAIKNASERASAVDRSVLHTKFVIENLKKFNVKEVLLLKKFLMSNDLYGAEIKVEGFSGYLCELLIIKYRNFANLLKNAAKWKVPIFIDIKKYYKTNAEMELMVKRFNSPFIVIDPTDKNRNVAAAVSSENLRRFTVLARKFLHSPNKKFFNSQLSFQDKLNMVSKKSGTTYVISIQRPEIVEDIMWGQLKKLSNQLLQFLKSNDFVCLETLLDGSGEFITIGLRLKEDKLSKKKILSGPSIRLEKNTKEFKKAHTNSKFFIQKGRIAVITKRKLVKIENAIKKFFSVANLPSHFTNIKNTWELKKYN